MMVYRIDDREDSSLIGRDVKHGVAPARRWPSGAEWAGGILFVVTTVLYMVLVFGWGELLARRVFGW